MLFLCVPFVFEANVTEIGKVDFVFLVMLNDLYMEVQL